MKRAVVTKEVTVGKNTYKKGVEKNFSDEIFAKHKDSLSEVKAKKTAKRSE